MAVVLTGCVLLLQVIIWSLSPQPFVSAATDNPSRLVNCSAREFLCKADNRCIPNSKVCNFVIDCSDGSDESRCGTCNFERAPKSCGLTFLPDRAFSWYRMRSNGNVNNKNDDDNSNNSDISGYTGEPMHYMQLDFDSRMDQFIGKHKNNDYLVYKPKVELPLSLKPTNNDKCRLSLQIRIAENPAKLGNHTFNSKASWPRVIAWLVKPDDPRRDPRIINADHKTNRTTTQHDLFVKRHSAGQRGKWLIYEVPFGLSHTIWTAELVFELRIHSYLVHVSNFRFYDCQHLNESSSHSGNVDGEKGIDDDDESLIAQEEIEPVCRPSEFRCQISRACIDQAFVCDFGHDCGLDDDSDEEQCDEFPGRCDFEDRNQCRWNSAPFGNAWQWMSSFEDDQAYYERQLLARPPVDHTFLSQQIGGHYMQVNSSLLRKDTGSLIKPLLELVGPRVRLHNNANECRFRFWISASFEDPSASPFLTVNNQDFSIDSLMQSNEAQISSSNVHWRRIEVSLLSRNEALADWDPSSITALRLAFGKFTTDRQLMKFLNISSAYYEQHYYLALDDFSFTPGCQLIYRGDPIDTCGDHQFYCSVPTPITAAECIPLENYCDFKNDCGLEMGDVADDELECPSECRFSVDWPHCNFRVIDGSALKEAGGFQETDLVKEAFNWQMQRATAPSAGYLSVNSNCFNFINDFEESQPNPTQKAKWLRDLRIELPEFSKSHANCSFELDFEWSRDSENIFASIYIQSELLQKETLLKQMRPTTAMLDGQYETTRVEGRQRYRIGIGQQLKPFRLALVVSFEGDLWHQAALKQLGSFLINSYRFLGCSFPAGPVDPNDQIRFEASLEEMEDSGDLAGIDDYDSREDFLEYPLADEGAHLSHSCPIGQFQCHRPIVCIDAHLICDMQIDCQLSELDESLDSTCAGYHQYNFDYASSYDEYLELVNAGWLARPSSNSSSSPQYHLAIWRLVGEGNRSPNGFGPAYDHSRSPAASGESGKFLSFHSSGEQQQAEIQSPRFRARDSSCRLVFYYYFVVASDKDHDHDHFVEFEVIEQSYSGTLANGDDNEQPIANRTLYKINSSQLTRESSAISDSKETTRFDAWQRFQLDHLGTSDESSSSNSDGIVTTGNEFSIVFKGRLIASNSRARQQADLIALDDVSFSSSCELKTNPNDTKDEKLVPKEQGKTTSWLTLVIVVICLSVLVGALFVGAVFARHGFDSVAGNGSGSALGRLDGATVSRRANSLVAQYSRSANDSGLDQIKLATAMGSEHSLMEGEMPARRRRLHFQINNNNNNTMDEDIDSGDGDHDYQSYSDSNGVSHSLTVL